MRLSALLLPLTLIAGCSAFQTIDVEDLPPSNLAVTFSDAPYETAFVVEGKEGAILVRDRAVTGVCHRNENRGAYLEDGTVTLWIAHTGERGEICQSIGRLVPYNAMISGLEPGAYLVRVQYIGQISSDTYPRPELDVEVVVQ